MTVKDDAVEIRLDVKAIERCGESLQVLLEAREQDRNLASRHEVPE